MHFNKCWNNIWANKKIFFGILNELCKIKVILKILPNFCELFDPYWVKAFLILLITCILKPLPSDSLKHSLCVCFASSLVGHKINALNPCLWGPFKAWIIGTKNAAVFPDPVGAQAKICRP